MGVGLETRVPFLDHRLVEFSWRLPIKMKYRDGLTKWILRQILYKYIPSSLIERPKAGFGIPIDVWLKGPLRDWAEELLDETRLKNEGFLDAKNVRKKWAEHIAGRKKWQPHLWGVLMFQSWLKAQSNQ
jgi:asparagine synthase (glutamine-hydrolysing)